MFKTFLLFNKCILVHASTPSPVCHYVLILIWTDNMMRHLCAVHQELANFKALSLCDVILHLLRVCCF